MEAVADAVAQHAVAILLCIAAIMLVMIGVVAFHRKICAGARWQVTFAAFLA